MDQTPNPPERHYWTHNGMAHQPEKPADDPQTEPVRVYHTGRDLYPRPKPLPANVYYINAPDSPGPRIRRAFNITEKDLDANREGYLSPTHRQRLLYKNNKWIAICFIAAVMLTGWPSRILTEIGFSLIAWLWVMIIWGIFLWEFAAQTRLYRALLRGHVEAVRAQIRIVPVGPTIRVTTSHVVIAAEKQFAINAKVSRGFVDNEDYTLYFLPGIDHLVSAEHHPVSYHSGEFSS